MRKIHHPRWDGPVSARSQGWSQNTESGGDSGSRFRLQIQEQIWDSDSAADSGSRFRLQIQEQIQWQAVDSSSRDGARVQVLEWIQHPDVWDGACV